MARKMAAIRIIDRITPIPDADRIETAHIGGWPVVIGKDENMHEGDKIIYFEPDSMLPLDKPQFASLAGRGKNRENDKGEMCVVLRTVKLRKQLSQGLALPLDAFDINEDIDVGTDVSELLGVQKYDPPEIIGRPANMSSWPSFLSRTDEERIQNLISMIRWFAGYEHTDEFIKQFHPSEKLDGTSTTYYRVKDDEQPNGYRYGACSRNNEVKRADDNTFRNVNGTVNVYWRNYDAYDMNARLDALHALYPNAMSVAIQGESTGPGINGNRLNRKDIGFHAFNVLIDGERVNPADVEPVKDIVVPQLDLTLPFHTGGDPLDMMDAALNMVDGIHSALDKNRLAEGVVWRYDGELPDGFHDEWKHFKTISNKYLLKAD